MASRRDRVVLGLMCRTGEMRESLHGRLSYPCVWRAWVFFICSFLILLVAACDKTDGRTPLDGGEPESIAEALEMMSRATGQAYLGASSYLESHVDEMTVRSSAAT